MVPDKPQKDENFHFTWYDYIGFRTRWYVKLVKSEVERLTKVTVHLSHTIQNGGLNLFLFWQAFDNFLGVYELYKVDMHQIKLNSARIFQEINIFASFLLSCSCMSKILYKDIQILMYKY